VTLNGPCRRGASFAVPYGNGRFFPSSHTSCPIVHRFGGVFTLWATLLRAWMANNRFRRMLDRYSSAVWFFDSAHCPEARGGSHPINSSFGAKPVVEFLLLLWTAVAIGSHLLHSFWFAVIRRKYCSIHWFVRSDRPSV
jgi:hypothetical protein